MADLPKSSFASLRSDLPAAIVVFFVALPLCLGIALASGAPLFSGLIAGIVGGIIVGIISGSQIGVSGPAAGLAAIVLAAVLQLTELYGEEGWSYFLCAVVIGGAIQLIFGVLKLGIIGYYFPSSVIKGMLTGIGLIIILKQIPHFLGRDNDPEGDFAFFQIDGENTFTEIINSIGDPSPGPTLIGFIALAILILWEVVLTKKSKFFRLVQGPLVAVVAGVIYYIVTQGDPTWGIIDSHLVQVPVPESANDFIGQFTLPNFAGLTEPYIWITGFTIALVASLETLLCVEATDKLDPHKRVTPTNRELLAQGTGNIVSGMIGGLPITQVIVRSSANIQSGGQTKLSAIIHGFFLVASVILIPTVLNMIPLAVLAAVLLLVGYKLAKPATFAAIYRTGWKQFVPFIVTVIGIIFTDLLTGIGLGLAVGLVVILYKSYQNSHFLHEEPQAAAAAGGSNRPTYRMELAEQVTFFNKAAILNDLDELPPGSLVEIDARRTRYLDYDVIEILDQFGAVKAKERNIDIRVIGKAGEVMNPASYTEYFGVAPAAGGH